MTPAKKNQYRNIILLVSSYIFYGWWDWRFLILIIVSSISDFFIGRLIPDFENKQKKTLLTLSFVINLGILGFFKYFNFFIENTKALVEAFGFSPNISSLNIILPVGISFYTFQTLSYTIDVYRGKIHPEKNMVSFFSFVAFFPQLVAGPIERASNLLPQFSLEKKFDTNNFEEGSRLILWGLFKKLIVADNCAVVADRVFFNPEGANSYFLIIGVVAFSFQIYGDFSGYSDMAIGISRLFGIKLMTNFKSPYLSRDIAEFWRRWHISLSTWFRDYLYIPLGGSRVSNLISIRNTFIIFLVSGLWHGANWTFIAWGFLHALLFTPLLITKKNRRFLTNDVSLSSVPAIFITYILVCFAWIFFRAESIQGAFNFIYFIFNNFSEPFKILVNPYVFLISIISISALMMAEYFCKGAESPTRFFKDRVHVAFRWATYLVLIISFFIFRGKHQEFIYFQF